MPTTDQTALAAMMERIEEAKECERDLCLPAGQDGGGSGASPQVFLISLEALAPEDITDEPIDALLSRALDKAILAMEELE